MVKLLNLKNLDDVPTDELMVVCKYHSYLNGWNWYVIAGEKQADGDYLLFGYVEGFEKELGFFTLSEIKSIGGCKVDFTPCKLSDVID